MALADHFKVECCVKDKIDYSKQNFEEMQNSNFEFQKYEFEYALAKSYTC